MGTVFTPFKNEYNKNEAVDSVPTPLVILWKLGVTVGRSEGLTVGFCEYVG